MKLVTTTQQRRFTPIDAAILLAAVAMSVAWVINTQPLLTQLAESIFFTPRLLVHPAAAFLVPLTLALLILRLRRPRPPLVLCLRQPGAVACFIAAIFLVLEVLNHFLDLTYRLLDVIQLRYSIPSYKLTAVVLRSLTLFDSIAFSIGAAPGLAVAGAYSALWSAGLWRKESSWIDRAGQILGWCWIAVAIGFIMFPPWSPD
jgi:hypothetical protein